MKICSPQLGVSPNSSLGGEIYDYQTLKGFTQRGLEVYVYLPKNRTYDKNLKRFHVDYCFITHIVPPWIYSFICLPYLFRTYKEESFDVLRVHSPRFLGLAALIFHLFFPHVPILSSQVTVDSSPLFFPIEWFTFKISKKIIVQSEHLKKIIVKKYHVTPTKIIVTYGGQLNNCPTSGKTPKRAKGLSKTAPVILFMGVLVKRKNPLFLAEVFKLCKELIPNLQLVIIGNGPEKKHLIKRLSDNSLLKYSTLIDSAYAEEKTFWLKRMNVFLMPSLDEGFGLALTEAMTLAKPVIASDIDPFKEIIRNNINGYLIPVENQTKWVKTIYNLISSEKLSKRIASNAKKTVDNNFNWERTYDLNYEVVNNLIK